MEVKKPNMYHYNPYEKYWNFYSGINFIGSVGILKKDNSIKFITSVGTNEYTIEMLEEIVNFMKEQIKEQKRKKKGKK